MPRSRDYDDDIFANTRMTFGEHLEELRTHLLRAVKGLFFCLVIGFVLDSIGSSVGPSWLGIGKPMMQVITAPVKKQLNVFYDRRMKRLMDEKERGEAEATAVTKMQPMAMRIPPDALAAIRGVKDAGSEAIDVNVLVDPVQLYKAGQLINNVIRPPELSTLSVTESMMVYIKVSLLCGLVLASPWVFWQVWSFIGAGLYPHEKHYIHKYLPLSLGLFLFGIALCQFAVLPRSVEALLWFNDWIGFNPDLRLNEWLSFAILLPLVFGVSFQTPLVMLFLERIGVMTVVGYLAAWRMAAFLLALIACIITPTPDAITMLAMWVPLVGLYFFGIGLCMWAGRNDPAEEEMQDADDLVEA